jgi:hypothetical protein
VLGVMGFRLQLNVSETQGLRDLDLVEAVLVRPWSCRRLLAEFVSRFGAAACPALEQYPANG